MSSDICWYHLDLYAEMYSPQWLRDLPSQLAALGFNGIVLEIAGRLHYRTVPDFGAADALTPEELRAFCDNARQHGLAVVPLLQHLGHLGHLLTREPYRHLREDPSTPYSLCPLHPEARPTLERILEETMAAVGGADYLHLGGDEAGHLGDCPKCAAFVADSSKSELYMQHYGPLCRRVLELGARPIIWHDMAAAHPECLDELPRETVFLDWDYSRNSSSAERARMWRHPNVFVSAAEFEALEPPAWRERYRPYFLYDDGSVNPYYSAEFLLDQGFEVILGSACRCSGDSYWFPDNHRHLPNLVQTAHYARQSGVRGVCVTDWSVRGSPPGVRLLGIAVGALALNEGLDVGAAAERFAADHCGLPVGSGATLLEISDTLSAQPPMSRPCRIAEDDEFGPQAVAAVLPKLELPAERDKLAALRPRYEEALAAIRDLEAKAEGPGREWLGQWVLAADMLLARLDTLERIFDGTEDGLATGRAEQILGRLDEEEARCLELLSPVYSAASLEQHLRLRFAGERAWLQQQ